MSGDSAVQSERFNILLSKETKARLTTAARSRGISRSEYIRFALEKAFQQEQENEIRRAVRELAPLYNTDPELTAFTDLDGEDFS